MIDVSDIVDTQRYPIFEPESQKARAFFDRCRADYARNGVVRLEGFVTANWLEKMAGDARAVEHLSFKQEKRHNVYLAEFDPAFDEMHPRNRVLVTTNSTIADADIQADGPLRALYQCQALHNFIAFVTRKDAIYPYVDKLSPLNIGVTRPGETLAWHFDTSDFATTLLLQDGQHGGEFEYIPATRSADDPAFEQVGSLLDGETSKVETLDVRPGTLVLFQGRHAIHRVTPVTGNQIRLMAVLTYDEKPGQQMNAYTQKKFYGRAL